jgi:hypothetical protein
VWGAQSLSFILWPSASTREVSKQLPDVIGGRPVYHRQQYSQPTRCHQLHLPLQLHTGLGWVRQVCWTTLTQRARTVRRHPDTHRTGRVTARDIGPILTVTDLYMMVVHASPPVPMS